MRFDHKISEEIQIQREADWLFDFTQDFGKRLKWDKQTKEIAFMNGHEKLEKGAKVFTVSVEGIRMETVYLSFERSKEISIRMLNRSTVFKDFEGTWNYIPIDTSTTILRISYQFNLRFPYNLASSIVLGRISRNINNKLIFLQSYLEE